MSEIRMFCTKGEKIQMQQMLCVGYGASGLEVWKRSSNLLWVIKFVVKIPKWLTKTLRIIHYTWRKWLMSRESESWFDVATETCMGIWNGYIFTGCNLCQFSMEVELSPLRCERKKYHNSSLARVLACHPTQHNCEVSQIALKLNMKNNLKLCQDFRVPSLHSESLFEKCSLFRKTFLVTY